MVENSTNERERLNGDISSYWQSHLKKWQESQLPQIEYCRRHNLKYHQFHYWKKRFFKKDFSVQIKGKPGKKDDLVFLKLDSPRKGPIPNRPSSPDTGLSEKPLRFWVNGFCVEVDNHFCTNSLSRLVHTLRAI